MYFYKQQHLCNEAISYVTVDYWTPRPSYQKKNIYGGSIMAVNGLHKDIKFAVEEFYGAGEYPASRKPGEILKGYTIYWEHYLPTKTHRKLNFKYRKCNDNKQFFMEKKDIFLSHT